jgi:hypothetical protein
MTKFLALYIGSASASEKENYSPTPDEEKMWADGMVQWGEWMQEHSGEIVDAGAPLGKTLRASLKRTTRHENRIVGYVFVEADNHQAAADLFRSHPHFAVMPGDSVEIMECLPPPGQA